MSNMYILRALTVPWDAGNPFNVNIEIFISVFHYQLMQVIGVYVYFQTRK